MTLSNSFSDPNRPQPFHARKHSHCKLKTAALTFILLRHLSVRSQTYFCSQFRFLFTFLQRILCSFDTFSPRHVFLSSPPKSTFCVKPRRFDLASNRSAGIDILFRGLRLTSIHFLFFLFCPGGLDYAWEGMRVKGQFSEGKDRPDWWDELNR